MDTSTTIDDFDDWGNFFDFTIDQWPTDSCGLNLNPEMLDATFPDLRADGPPSVYPHESQTCGEFEALSFTWDFDLPQSHLEHPEVELPNASLPNQQHSQGLISMAEGPQERNFNNSDKPERTDTGRKWQDSVILFHADPKSTSKVRKRKRFRDEEKKEVALNRTIGNCMPCRLRKGKCNPGMPCKECIKRAGSLSLGQELCGRQKLIATRFNKADFLQASEFGEILRQTQFIHSATPRHLYIIWQSFQPDQNSKNFSVVEVQDITLPPVRLETMKGDLQVVKHIINRSVQDVLYPDSAYMILPNSMPSVDELSQYGDSFHPPGVRVRDYHLLVSGLSSLHAAFYHFSRRYCNINRQMPLQSLLGDIVRMRNLLTAYRKATVVVSNLSDPNLHYGSSWMKLQLRHFIAGEIIKLEAHILIEFEKIAFSSDSLGKRNPLAFWVCLWEMILCYRTHFLFIYCHTAHDQALLNSLYGLAKHMYNALTSIYTALYKTNSPLLFDWRKDEVASEMLGDDPELIRLFSNIKTEMFWFHADRDKLPEEDNLLKTLVVENELKLLESQKKVAKNLGIL